MKQLVSSVLAVSIFAIAVSAVPAYAATTKKTASTLNVACVAAAVDARESAIITAYQNRSTSVITALQTRQSALGAAWAISTSSTRNAAIKAAWSAYRHSFQQANATFKKARMSAWTTFNTARKSCGGSTWQSSDTGTMGLDNSL